MMVMIDASEKSFFKAQDIILAWQREHDGGTRPDRLLFSQRTSLANAFARHIDELLSEIDRLREAARWHRADEVPTVPGHYWLRFKPGGCNGAYVDQAWLDTWHEGTHCLVGWYGPLPEVSEEG